AYDNSRKEGTINTRHDLQEAVEEGAVKRIRPKMMTVMAILLGLLPIMWGHGAGADVMKRIAAPMVGGVVSSFAPARRAPPSTPSHAPGSLELAVKGAGSRGTLVFTTGEVAFEAADPKKTQR